MRILGQYDTTGNYLAYTSPIEVVELGNTLRDKMDGFIWAIKDDYGDWVSPALHKIGVKSKIKIGI